MNTRIEKTADGTAWNLYVNGYPAVTYETHAVCCAIEAALLQPLSGRFYSEAAEVAHVIRQSLEEHRREAAEDDARDEERCPSGCICADHSDEPYDEA